MKRWILVFISLITYGACHSQGSKGVGISSLTFHAPHLTSIPHEVPGVAHSSISLNGTWKFNAGSTDDKDIQVPGEWEMQGFHLDSASTGKYLRKFVIPDDWKGKTVKLRFDAVNSHSIIHLNGRLVGQHEGSFVPFEFDITHFIHAGENTLEVAVQCQTISDILACTSQYAGHPVGGILRKVTLFVLPGLHIGDLSYVTAFDHHFKDATLQISFDVPNEDKQTKDADISFTLLDRTGKMILPNRHEFPIHGVLPGSSKKDTVNLKIKAPEQWNPEHPYLYTLVTQLKVNGRLTETHLQKIGFRQIEIRGNQLFVNNYPVKLHGVCRHAIHPLTGRSLSAALCWKDAELFRNGNCNYIRTSHYPPSEEFLDACDSLGLFVESESSLCWIEHGASPIWKTWNYTDPKFLPYMVNANLEKMMADRNHPAVIIWSLGNESRWSPLWAKVNEMVKQLDPSRPTAFQDQCWGGYNNAGSQCDIANYHYPEFNGPSACDTMKRPTLFDEYAHVENYNRREVLTDPFIRAAWGPPLEQMYDSIQAHRACLGGAIWAGIDDIFHMPDGRIIGYGPWGVIDGWRREKPEYFAMKKAYAPIIIKKTLSPTPGHPKLILQIENRYDFTNLRSIQFTYQTANHSGILKADIPPHQSGDIEIPLSEKQWHDHPVLITFRDPRGYICQQELLASEQNKAPMPSTENKGIELHETEHFFLITLKNTIYQISKSTGQMEHAEINGVKVITGTPDLSIVPLNDDDGGGKGIAGCNYQRNITPLLYPGCRHWKAASIQAAKEGDSSVKITVHGGYTEAEGIQTMQFSKTGTVTLDYAFTLKDTIQINPRQWGITFTLPPVYRTLKWQRKGRWSIYPETDIARNKGVARANPVPLKYVEAMGKPTGPWSKDANALGSRDFRSTKKNIYRASLTNKNGTGIQIISDGTQSSRSWISNGQMTFLVAQYNSGGADGFSSFFYRKERTPLKGGDVLKGQVKFKLVDYMHHE